MIASSTLSWALLVISFSADSHQVQAMTSIDGFGSQEACQMAQQIAHAQLPEQVAAPLMLCLPVDAARPLPDVLRNLIIPE